jgi:putative pyruvate formate lyase activating enzyme
MPGLVEETVQILRWLAEEISPDTYVNLMAQYRPDYRVPGNPRYRDIDRRPRPEELAAAGAAGRGAGLWRFDRP